MSDSADQLIKTMNKTLYGTLALTVISFLIACYTLYTLNNSSASSGAAGAAGAAGVQGPAGPQGPAGRDGQPAPTKDPNDPLCVKGKCITDVDIVRYSTMFPSGYANVVSRRPLIGNGLSSITKAVGGTVDKMTQLLPTYVYGPFGYNVPAPAPGTVRKWRMYAVYSDNVTGGSGPVLRLQIKSGSDWGKTINDNMNFQFPLTWGGVGGETRDSYSNMLDDPPEKMHCLLYSYFNSDTKADAQVLWTYVELQALDVYP
jgi:hypothetical protein